MLSIPNDSPVQREKPRLLWPFRFSHWNRTERWTQEWEQREQQQRQPTELPSICSWCRQLYIVFIYFMHHTIIILITFVNRFICSEFHPQNSSWSICTTKFVTIRFKNMQHQHLPMYIVLFRWLTNSIRTFYVKTGNNNKYAIYTFCTFKSPWTRRKKKAKRLLRFGLFSVYSHNAKL